MRWKRSDIIKLLVPVLFIGETTLGIQFGDALMWAVASKPASAAGDRVRVARPRDRRRRILSICDSP